MLEFVCRLLDRFVDNMKFNIEFTINRLTLRLQHRAAEFAAKHELGEVLFPAVPAPSQRTNLPNLRSGTRVCVQCLNYLMISLYNLKSLYTL